ncbi:DUF4124 domain-containing protein [Rhodoferax sp.]|uniref:DUF4124 domain-containing protein n=1 Tax=Rhodoferax sp. TaxID=50421 RepID=UPI0027555217|nr:DUF4124 domain-containing protein [Rhodoferax sp.]
MRLIQAALVLVACTVSTSLLAQWQWVDKDGRKVFSDRPPPSDIPPKNILKQPAGRTTMPAAIAPIVADGADQPSAAASAPLAGASGPKGSGVDKALEDKKKKAAQAELAKKRAEEEQVTKAKIENCARAKQAKATYESGIRIARTNEKGEREVLDESARAAESKRIQAVIDSDCQ